MPLTAAYRSLSRPSSASCAKASTVCPYHLLFDTFDGCEHTLARDVPARVSDAVYLKKILVTLCSSLGTARAGPRDRTLRALARRGHQLGTDGTDRQKYLSLEEVILPRKEVIQPHLPVRLPCYDFTPLTNHTFGTSPPRGLGRRLRVQSTRVV